MGEERICAYDPKDSVKACDALDGRSKFRAIYSSGMVIWKQRLKVLMCLSPVFAHPNVNSERHSACPGSFHLFFSLSCPVHVHKLSIHFMHSTQHATVWMFLAQLLAMIGNFRIFATKHLGNTFLLCNLLQSLDYRLFQFHVRSGFLISLKSA